MRKPWVLLVALAVAAGCGGGNGPRAAQPPASPSPTATAAAAAVMSPSSAVSTAAPRLAYVLKDRLHVGGEVMPGRFGAVTARGDVWVANANDGTMFWGRGTEAHLIPDQARGWLSADGRYLLTASRTEDCSDSFGKPTCVLRLHDLTGKQPERSLVLRRSVEVFGVSNRGLVMLTGATAFRWEPLLWDAARGARAVQPLRESPAMTSWAMQWWDPVGFGPAGFEFSGGNVSGHWLGVIVDGELRPRLQLPGGNETEVGPGGKWVVSTAWPDGRTYPATKQVIGAWMLGGNGKQVRLPAPPGWFFAETSTPVSWESADDFLVMVVDTRKGGDRIARCNLPLATCAVIQG